LYALLSARSFRSAPSDFQPAGLVLFACTWRRRECAGVAFVLKRTMMRANTGHCCWSCPVSLAATWQNLALGPVGAHRAFS